MLGHFPLAGVPLAVAGIPNPVDTNNWDTQSPDSDTWVAASGAVDIWTDVTPDIDTWNEVA